MRMQKNPVISCRLLPQFESLDIVSIIRGTLCRIDHVPMDSLGLCCNCAVNVARSLRTDYLKWSLPTLRISLQAVPLKYPKLLGAVRAASWYVQYFPSFIYYFLLFAIRCICSYGISVRHVSSKNLQLSISNSHILTGK